MSRGRRHTLALGAAKNVRSGMAPDAALAAALDGKTLAATDRTLVEQELAELLERDPPPAAAPGPTAEEVRAEVIAEVDAVMDAVGPGEWDSGAGFIVAPIVVPDDDGSVEVPDDGGSVPDAMLEVVVPFDPNFAESPVIAPPGAAERDAEVERIASGTAGGRAKHERRSTTERLDAALVDLRSARTEVRRLRYLALADHLATSADGKPAASVLRSAVNAGFWAEAESVARRGCTHAGIDAPQWLSEHTGPHTLRLDIDRATPRTTTTTARCSSTDARSRSSGWPASSASCRSWASVRTASLSREPAARSPSPSASDHVSD